MKKIANFILILFLVLTISSCLNAVHTNQDIINGVMSLYSDYNVEILDSSDDCVILKIKKGDD